METAQITENFSVMYQVCRMHFWVQENVQPDYAAAGSGSLNRYTEGPCSSGADCHLAWRGWGLGVGRVGVGHELSKTISHFYRQQTKFRARKCFYTYLSFCTQRGVSIWCLFLSGYLVPCSFLGGSLFLVPCSLWRGSLSGGGVPLWTETPWTETPPPGGHRSWWYPSYMLIF